MSGSEPDGFVGGVAQVVQADFAGLGEVSTRIQEDAPRVMQSLSEHATEVRPEKLGGFYDAEMAEKAISDGFRDLGNLTKDLMTSEISLAIFAQLASQELGGQDGSSGQTLASHLTGAGVLSSLDGTEDPFATTSRTRLDAADSAANSGIIEVDGRFGIDWNSDGVIDHAMPQVRLEDGEYFVDIEGNGEWTVFTEPEPATTTTTGGDPMAQAAQRGMVDPWHEEAQETQRQMEAEQRSQDQPWYQGFVPRFGPLG